MFCHCSLSLPGADTSTAAITVMIQKVQSAARRTVIGDFNHFNFQKVLEQRVICPARHHGALLVSVTALSGEVGAGSYSSIQGLN